MALLAKSALGLFLAVALIGGGAWWYSLQVPERAFHGPLPPLTAAETELARRLRSHVVAIASEPHNVGHYAALERAAAYIESELRSFGIAPVRQVFFADGRAVANIEATIEPRAEPTTSLVVGAHYDSAGTAPGANDNGSGVAALLELARLAKAAPAPSKRLRLVFFVNEEPPYFQTDLMGSRRYATLLAQRREAIDGMIALETLGAYSSEPGSQRYPSPFDLLLPDVGNFLAFVAMPGSRTFMHEVIRAFRRSTRFPTIGGVAPAFIKGVGWSDHASFSSRGIPALMITDTAVFRYRHYHTPADTPDKVDYRSLARVTAGLGRAIANLAQ